MEGEKAVTHFTDNGIDAVENGSFSLYFLYRILNNILLPSWMLADDNGNLQ